MKRFAVITALLTLVVAAIVTLSSCGGTSDQTGDRLVILSPHWEGIQDEFDEGFSTYWREKTGNEITIDWLDQGGTSQIMRYIRSEFSNSPEGIGVDLLFGGGLDPFIRLTDADLTVAWMLPDSIINRIPGSFAGIPLYDPAGHWYGAAMSGFGIIYNSAAARMQGSEPPTSWEDMADPALLGWIAAGDPRMSGSVHMAYEIMLQAYGWERGWEIVTALCANSRSFARSAGDIPLGVSRGDAVAGMAIDFYAWSEINKAEGQELGYVYPENRTVINPDAMAILKGAPNLDIAKEFITYVVGEPGQRIWAFKQGEPGGPQANELTRFPVMADLYDTDAERIAVNINPFEWESTFHYNDKLGSSRYDLVNDMIGSMVIDSHRELVKAWKALQESGASAEGMATLAYPPISEAQAADLAGRWGDQTLRNGLISEWTQFARRRYTAVENRNYGPIERPAIPPVE
jgi:ABC-type Fe3+ transport system substrate-binding protein